ncbi:hypothetical protein RIF29_33540 [Crotalaria pallida]|uniref:Uncharacterized protein n=1 Tax=Crotalaria pallida TaxID=3830 RepID=A0AAN9E8E5_CROPI
MLMRLGVSSSRLDKTLSIGSLNERFNGKISRAKRGWFVSPPSLSLFDLGSATIPIPSRIIFISSTRMRN